MIDIFLDSDKVPVGGNVKGTAHWVSSSTKPPQGAEVRLVMKTGGFGTPERRRLPPVRTDVGPEDLAPSLTVPFSLSIPKEGPISYHGSLITVQWAVEVRIDLPWAVDETASRGFAVVPAPRGPRAA